MQWNCLTVVVLRLFLFSHSSSLPDPVPTGTQIRCQHHRHCLNFFTPLENEVLIFLHGREKRCLKMGDGGCYSIPVCYVLFTSIKVHAWVWLCRCGLASTAAVGCILWPSCKGGFLQCGQNHKWFFFFFLPEHSFVKCFPHNWWQMSASVCCFLHISKWHVSMSSRIKCCSQAFLLLKCLHAVFHVCVMEGNLHSSQFTSIFWREKHREQPVSFTSTGTLNSILKQIY